MKKQPTAPYLFLITAIVVVSKTLNKLNKHAVTNVNNALSYFKLSFSRTVNKFHTITNTLTQFYHQRQVFTASDTATSAYTTSY